MTKLEALKDYAAALHADVLEHEPMSLHTTFKIGGPADVFITPDNDKSIHEIILYCKKNEIPLTVVGNGSNMLVSDEGIRGAVLRLGKNTGIAMPSDTEIVCGAGAKLADVCVFARDHSLTGLEFAYGIPGTVGGAVYMNAGAYGGEMKDVVTSTSYVTKDGFGSFTGEEHDFSYRHSAYTNSDRIITEVRLQLRSGGREQIGEKMRELTERRKNRQPLEYPSAGSVFKRPEGHYSGPLIEQAGLKGRRVGGAMVSEKHANFIINAGGATCADVLALIDIIKKEVYKNTGIMLESEVKVIV